MGECAYYNLDSIKLGHMRFSFLSGGNNEHAIIFSESSVERPVGDTSEDIVNDDFEHRFALFCNSPDRARVISDVLNSYAEYLEEGENDEQAAEAQPV